MIRPIPRRWALGAIVLVAVLCRLEVVAWTRSYLISPAVDHFAFGYEAGRIARSLALGEGFASPLPLPTGPTALLPLGYPLLLSGIFRLFGVYTVASAWAAYVLNAIAGGLTCLVLYRLGSLIFGGAVGLLSAALFALYPNSVWFGASTIWDTSLLALCVPALVLWFCLLPPDPPPGKLVLSGFLMGLLSLFNPALGMAGAVGLVVWMRIRLRAALPAWGWKPALVALVCLLVLIPWMIRNAVAVGEFTPRSSGGLNLRLGNNELAWESGTGLYQSALSPADSAAEGKRMRDLGEVAYDRECGRQALAFIRRNPGKFLVLTGERIRSWWMGYDSGYTANFHGISHPIFWKRVLGSIWLPFFLAGAVLAVRRGYSVFPLLATILIYPIPYYVTIVSERYRFPTEPLILILAAYCLTVLWAKARGRFSQASGGTAGIDRDNFTLLTS